MVCGSKMPFLEKNSFIKHTKDVTKGMRDGAGYRMGHLIYCFVKKWWLLQWINLSLMTNSSNTTQWTKSMNLAILPLLNL